MGKTKMATKHATRTVYTINSRESETGCNSETWFGNAPGIDRDTVLMTAETKRTIGGKITLLSWCDPRDFWQRVASAIIADGGNVTRDALKSFVAKLANDKLATGGDTLAKFTADAKRSIKSDNPKWGAKRVANETRLAVRNGIVRNVRAYILNVNIHPDAPAALGACVAEFKPSE
jgi:hypothetical protein